MAERKTSKTEDAKGESAPEEAAGKTNAKTSNAKTPGKKKPAPRKRSTPRKKAAQAAAPEKAPAPKPEPAAKQPPPPPPKAEGPVTVDEVLPLLYAHYPRSLRPVSVGYFLAPEWRKNLEARFQAEQGQRFFESLVETVEQASGLDVAERFSLVDRPAFCLRILLHDRQRFPGPVLTDSFLRNLGGEARLLDVWISALGPFYYAKGFRLWPSVQEELEGPPPPLDRKDPIALRAMRILAAELKKIGFRRVPGSVGKAPVPGVRIPGQIVDENPTVFDLLFDSVPANQARELEGEPVRRRERPPPPSRPSDYEVDESVMDPGLKREIDLEVEIFQRELEDEIDAIKAEMERARRPKR